MTGKRPVDNSGVPAEVLGGDVGDTQTMDERALSLGVDSAGGYAVPYQLDGTKTRKPSKPAKASKPKKV